MGCIHCTSTVRLYGRIDQIRLTRQSFSFRFYSENDKDVPFRFCKLDTQTHHVTLQETENVVKPLEDWLDLTTIQNGWYALIELPVTELRKDVYRKRKQEKAMYLLDRCCVSQSPIRK